LYYETGYSLNNINRRIGCVESGAKVAQEDDVCKESDYYNETVGPASAGALQARTQGSG